MGKKGKNKSQTVISVNEASPKLEDKVEEKKVEPTTAPAAAPASLPAPVPAKVEEKPTLLTDVPASDENDEPFEEGTLKSKKKRNRKKKSMTMIN